MSAFTDRARAELQRAGAFTEEDDFYGGMTGESVMQLVDVFSKQGHSGMSASLVSFLFKELVDGKPLSPLTNDPADWMDEHLLGPGQFQSRRAGSCFSDDGLKTYYNLDERRKWVRKVLPWAIYKQLPHTWKYPHHKLKEVMK